MNMLNTEIKYFFHNKRFQSYLNSNREKGVTTFLIVKLWKNQHNYSTQLTDYTLKLAHCIKQNGQEKSSVTALGKRQEMYQYCQNPSRI